MDTSEVGTLSGPTGKWGLLQLMISGSISYKAGHKLEVW